MIATGFFSSRCSCSSFGHSDLHRDGHWFQPSYPHEKPSD